LAQENGDDSRLTFLATLRTLPRPFWMCCVMEMWERLAYYGTRVVVPIYIAQADEPGGLHFTQAQKGTIYAWWALVQSLVPMVSGGIADRYGYKKMLVFYGVVNVTAFVLMGTQRSFWPFFFACLLLGFGTGFFKPALQGTLAQSTSPATQSLAWGLFYWLVNVGAGIGPPFAGQLRAHGWPFVFFGCAAITSLNFVMLLTYPAVPSGSDTKRSFVRVVRDTVVNLLDWKLVGVIALFSGIWMMLYQLWDFMPNFYADWTDSTDLVRRVPFPSSWLQTDARGVQLKQENALNLNAILIVLFVVPASYLVRKIPVLRAITIGTMIATVGTLVFGTSTSVWFVFLGIALFSAGEMLTGPKKSEYFASIAGPGKKALYLGYVNIPIAIGQAAGAKIVGALYGANGEKATLALRYLEGETHYPDAAGVKRTEAFATLVRVLGRDAKDVTQLLWDTYHPYRVWYPFAVTGVLCAAGLVLFARLGGLTGAAPPPGGASSRAARRGAAP
jgi:dipeptide/tripeptide permease